MKDVRVLITGGLGFIGSNLAHECVRRGARVTIYDSLDPRSGGNLRNLEGIEHDVELRTHDIRNFESLGDSVRGQEVIFHCAAHTSHAKAMDDPLTDIDVNCKGTVNLLEVAKRFQRDAKIVHIGTSTQIGKMVFPEVTETHPEFPADMYSANKSASEKYVLLYATAHGMRTTVVRLANNFGPRANIRSADFGFVNFFIGLGLKGKELTVFGTGQQLRSFSYVQDSVEALMLAAGSEAANGKALFAVADTQMTVLDIAAAINRNVGGSTKRIDWPKDRAAIEVGDAVISNAKIRELLGWCPQVSVDDGLRLTKQYFEPRLESYL